MIRCQLIHVTRNNRGQAIRQEQRLECDYLDIGRAAECKIRLSDHRVRLHHAVISDSDDGKFYIQGVNALLEINGAFESNAELSVGAHFRIGSYQLIVENISSEKEITLSCELVQRLPALHECPIYDAPMTIAATGLSKRKISLWLAGFIALVFLVLPMTYALNPKLHQALEDLPITPDESWNVGSMSPGHRALTTKCQTCHQQPFMAVKNQACESCHKNTPHHISNVALNDQVFDQMRCTECHRDHRGKEGLVRHDPQQCSRCHGNIKAQYSATKLMNIHDFDSGHPAFRLTIRTGPGEDDVKRIRQTNQSLLIEKSGLKFSHREHFDKALIELPDDNFRDIECSDCHVPDKAGYRFNPIEMPLTCQQSKCHSLEFTPAIDGRNIPHASTKKVMATLREVFASRAINQNEPSGKVLRNIKRVRQSIEAKTEKNALELFTKETEGSCLLCHEVTHDPNNKITPWSVTPVRVTEHWLPKSYFPHEKHGTATCTSCHDVLKSEKSSDIAIPTIDKCRECHVGSKQTKTGVSTTCNTCHRFHHAPLSNPETSTAMAE